MRLENLYPNFGQIPPEEQLAYISLYRFKRAEDMSKPATYKRKKVVKTKVEFSEEDKALMKLLGLKPKDLLALKESVEEEEQEEETGELFKDSTFEEEEE